MADPDPFEQIRRHKEMLRKAFDPPVLRQLRQMEEQQARIRDLMINPPVVRRFQELQEQQARIRDLMSPPVLRQLQQLQDQQSRIRDLMINPPTVRHLRQLQEQQARMQALFENPVVRSLREHRDEWNDLLTDEAVAEIDSLQSDLVDRIIEAAEADAEGTGTADPEEHGGVWFGAASWAALLSEIEGLLKALEVIAAAMTASKMALNAPIPTAILALLIVLVSASELALWLAKRDLEQ